MTTLFCIHGRGQHGKDPEDLRRKWAAGLNSGLTLAGRRTVSSSSLIFPFFGDLLEAKRLQSVRTGADLDLESAGALRDERISPLLPEDVSQVESDLLRSMAEQAGVETVEREGPEELILKIPGARRILGALADRTDIDQEVIEAFLTDVAVYYKYARKEVLDIVSAKCPSGDEPLVIIGHSLGSVVARDLLEDPAIRDRTVLLVTVGSPLGLQACYRNLLARGPVHPGRPWVTAFDPDDFVALGHPLKRVYGGPLDDLRVDNPPMKAHAIEHYLGHRAVAERIADALAL